jgi:hypothetical protein
MTMDRSIRPCRAINQDGDMGDSERRGGSDQIYERKLFHEVVQELAIFNEVRLGNIWGIYSDAVAGAPDP